MTQTKILVTGGAGFIGSHLVRQLVQEGHSVRVIDNLDPQVHGQLHEEKRRPDYCIEDAEYIWGDVRDRAIMKKALQGINVVYHFAAKVGVGQSMYEIEKYIDVNIHGTAVLLDLIANEATIRQNISKIIVASSMSNYGEGEYQCPVHGTVHPYIREEQQLSEKNWEIYCHHQSNGTACHQILEPTPTRESKALHINSMYAISKKTQEEMFMNFGKAYDLPAVAFRFFNTYGKYQALSNPYTGVVANFASRLLNGQAPKIFEDGNQIRDFVHVDDIVQANIIALNNPDCIGIYNAGSGHPVTIREVADAVIHNLNLSIEPSILNEYRVGDIRNCYANISKLATFGYSPKFTLNDGVNDIIPWLIKETPSDNFEQMKSLLENKGLTI